MSTVLEHYTKEDLLSRTSVRSGEQRLGERIAAVSEADWTSADSLPFKFVLVGVEEDFGVRANHGRGGADRAFQSFLSYFLNMQVNRFLPYRRGSGSWGSGSNHGDRKRSDRRAARGNSGKRPYGERCGTQNH